MTSSILRYLALGRVLVFLFGISSGACAQNLQADRATFMDVAGFDFPEFPLDIRGFDGAAFLEDTRVPDPLPFLSDKDKYQLAVNVFQICLVVQSAVRQEQSISDDSPIWLALVHYYPELNSSPIREKINSANRIRLIPLVDVLYPILGPKK